MLGLEEEKAGIRERNWEEGFACSGEWQPIVVKYWKKKNLYSDYETCVSVLNLYRFIILHT